MADLEVENSEIELTSTEHKVEVHSHDAKVEKADDLELKVNKREYSIVGDGLYASMSSETAPQWLLDIIDNTVSGMVNSKLDSLSEAINSINTSLLELDVAKNRYQELINIEQTIDGVIASKLETLNATVQQNSANIVALDTAKVTPDEALAISIDHVNAQINDGEIHSLVTDLQTAYANATEAMAQSIESLNAVVGENRAEALDYIEVGATETAAWAEKVTDLDTKLYDPDTGDIAGSAGALKTLESRVEETEEGVSATASEVTAINAYVKDSNGNMGGASSELNQDIIATSDGRIQTNFKYGSNIMVEGKTYTTGFGMYNWVAGAGQQPGSEFWINAQKLRFTNNTGATPNPNDVFTIDTTNGNRVKFNGVVEFTNVKDDNGNSLADASFGNPVVYRQTSAPTGDKVKDGDLWYNAKVGGTQYVRKNGAWVVASPVITDLSGYVENDVAAGVNNNTTTISGGKIATGTINLNNLSTYSSTINYTGTVLDNSGIKVYENGVLRVVLGQL